ncbi:hypothetical protein C8F01DRAFT_271367 [Mycena amicta]|nr:hypothetical protein C8F01DRAFT_271367 [Mycena amicta]
MKPRFSPAAFFLSRAIHTTPSPQRPRISSCRHPSRSASASYTSRERSALPYTASDGRLPVLQFVTQAIDHRTIDPPLHLFLSQSFRPSAQSPAASPEPIFAPIFPFPSLWAYTTYRRMVEMRVFTYLPRRTTVLCSSRSKVVFLAFRKATGINHLGPLAVVGHPGYTIHLGYLDERPLYPPSSPSMPLVKPGSPAAFTGGYVGRIDDELGGNWKLKLPSGGWVVHGRASSSCACHCGYLRTPSPTRRPTSPL